MNEQLQALEVRAYSAISGATTLAELEELKSKYLGQGGELSTLLAGLGALEPQQRLEMGATANNIRKSIETHITQSRILLQN